MVDPRWILKALAVVILAAALLAYVTLCLLLYQGSWQLIFHPTTRTDRTPASLSIPFEEVQFDAATTGQPRLTGWWIPIAAGPGAAGSSADSSGATLLVLHDGTGSLSSTLPLLALLHRSGVNVFAIDYRGFGRSAPLHPSEASMTQDSAAALAYLSDTRHLQLPNIIPYGIGLGGALASRLVRDQPSLPAVVIDNPDLATIPALLAEPRSRLLPMRLLLHDRFALDETLSKLNRPRLLLAGGPSLTNPARRASMIRYFKTVPDPRWTVDLPDPAVFHEGDPCRFCPVEDFVETLRRFIDEAIPAASLAPSTLR